MKYPLILLIKFYKKAISPFLRPSCRFYPTCSTYSLEAIEKHGALKGSYYSIKRILRCQPFSKGGYDPVPVAYNSPNILKENENKHQIIHDCNDIQIHNHHNH